MFSLFPSKPSKEEIKAKEHQAMVKSATLAQTQVALLPNKSELRSSQLEALEEAIEKLSLFINAIQPEKQFYNAGIIENLITKINALNGPLDFFLQKYQPIINHLGIANSNLEYNSDVKHDFKEIPFKKVLPGFIIEHLPKHMESIGKKLKRLEVSMDTRKKYIDDFKWEKHPDRFQKIYNCVIDAIEKLQREFAIAKGDDKGNYVPPEPINAMPGLR